MKKNVLTIILMLGTLWVSAQSQFRAAWFSTVANIDWPSREAIGHTDLQKQEMIDLLNQMEALHLNTVIFQIRPTADALYPSKLEPWSHWLTGKQGQNNDIPYDPLAMMVEEAHKRHMDVHVWVNPYRVTLPSQKRSDLSPDHLINRHPEMFWEYAGQWYFEPGLDETRKWLCDVVADIVTRYDIQGVHIDDYFYPYPKTGLAIPDAACFKAHPRGYTNIEDWRRNNVNMAMRELHETIHSIKPNVQFGIAPFGIWRNIQNDPRGSQTNGLQNYDALYADVLLWMQEGWIDYVVPQLYWEIGKTVADHEILAHWWAEASLQTHCPLYIGMSVGRLKDPKLAPKDRPIQPDAADPWQNGNEICRQLDLHQTIPGIQGEVFFSLRALLRNPRGICDSLKTKYFQQWVPAPLPASGKIELAPLQKGDLIALVTPSAFSDEEQVSKMEKGLHKWGYRTIRSEHVIGSVRTIQDRYEDMMAALRNPEVKAIYCVRGGYAASDVMDLIPLDTLRRYPKWMIGYSDITIFLNAWQAAGMPSIHASMSAVFENLPAQCKEQTRRVLAGERPNYLFESHPQNHLGHAEGILLGGNMSTFTATLMSAYDCTRTDEPIILMLEDVGETGNNLHRCLTILDHFGLLHRVKGLMFGEYTDFRMTPDDLSGLSHGGRFRDAEDIIARTLQAKGIDIPWALNLPFGHGEENYPFVLGEKIQLDVTPTGVTIHY